jgi:hypothetical protein
MKSEGRRECTSGHSIAELVSTDAIPVTETWSDSQKRLASKLASAIGDLASDADTFAVRTLVLGGDCTGLAYAATVRKAVACLPAVPEPCVTVSHYTALQCMGHCH